MKIKTQMSISIIVFVILATVIIFSYFFSENQLHAIEKSSKSLTILKNPHRNSTIWKMITLSMAEHARSNAGMLNTLC